MESSIKIAVIGAGISGLAAASSLVQEGFDVVLLEASDYIGGRLKQVTPFPGFPPVDVGGDFVHGSNSIINQLAKENGWNLKKVKEHPNGHLIFLNGNFYFWVDTDQPDICAAKKAMEEMISMNKTNNEDESYTEDFVHEKLNKLCSTVDSKEVVKAVYATTHAVNMSHYGLSELCEKLRKHSYWGTNKNYRLEESYEVLISYYLGKCVKIEKRLNWPVKEVKWNANPSEVDNQQTPGVVITSEPGESITVDYVVVTVPLTILKDGDIIFSPPLPLEKQHAINTIHMGTALKIVCRFKIPFWREKTLIFAAKGFLSQIWTYSREPKEDGEECHVVVGFDTAVSAAQKAHLSDQEICEKFLQQLDEMFEDKEYFKPATSNFMGFVYQHWSKHPYIRGGYSGPTANAYGLRQRLAAPVGGRLFFAGEATSPYASATVQSAIETGMRAAKEVKQTVGSGVGGSAKSML